MTPCHPDHYADSSMLINNGMEIIVIEIYSTWIGLITDTSFDSLRITISEILDFKMNFFLKKIKKLILIIKMKKKLKFHKYL